MSLDFSKDEIDQFLLQLSQNTAPFEIRVDGEFSFIQDHFIPDIIKKLNVPYCFYCLERKKDGGPHAHFFIPSNKKEDSELNKFAKSIRAKITYKFPQLKGNTQYKVGPEKKIGKLLPYIVKGDDYYYLEIEKGATARDIIPLVDYKEFSQSENDIVTEILKKVKEYSIQKIEDTDDVIETKMTKLSFSNEIKEAFSVDIEKIKSQRIRGGGTLMQLIRKWVCRYVIKNKWNYCEPSAVNKLTLFLLAEIEEDYAVEELYNKAERLDVNIY